ncbi:MAG: hypothetical protein R3C62_17150 [Chloroflexota bacterium]
MTLTQAEKAIKDAVVVGLIAIVVTVMLTLVYASGAGLAHIDPWNVADLIIMGLLVYGIHRKNRFAATIMPIYYLSVKTVLWVGEHVFIGVPLALIFAYFFVRGAQGAWAYYKLTREGDAVLQSL